MKKLIFLFLLLPTFIYSQTNISGIINANQTWTIAGSPYIVTNNILVNDNVTLTINPGVIVKFDFDKLLQIDGELIAQGTSSNKIIFTSNQITPQPGDWGGIVFSGYSDAAVFDVNENYLSGSILLNCVVKYGGANRLGVIELEGAEPLIKNSIISKNTATGILVTSPPNWPSPRILGNIIAYNSYSSLSEGGGIKLICASNFKINNNLFYGNTSSSISSGIHSACMYGTEFEINNNIFVSNVSQSNGTISISINNGGSIVDITHNTFIDNLSGSN